jgi:lauroyl/myristoyl acyltransferase
VANYELASLAAALYGGVGVALTLPEQPGGYKYHDKIRKDYGIEAMPASMASFKYATQVLREGGVVGTGLDRPLPDAGYKPMFFGRNASLPVHYVVLAMKAKVPMVMAYVKRQDNGIYKAFASGLIPVTDFGDRRSTILGNAERMLELIEEPIRQDPYQWAMFYSVWPDVAPNE